MKKLYEAPLAEKVEFNYLENVVASPVGNGPGLANEHANVNSMNHCTTGNNANIVSDPSCAAVAIPKPGTPGKGKGHH